MFGGNTIKLDKALMERAKQAAAQAGYASTDEFVVHVLEKELARLSESESDEEVKKRLKGLGYIS